MIGLGVRFKQCNGIQKDQIDEQKIFKKLKKIIHKINDLMKNDYIKPMY
jgi:hypothetical protein